MDFLHHTFTYWNAGGFLLIPLAFVCAGIWGCFLRTRERILMVLAETDSPCATTAGVSNPFHTQFLDVVLNDMALGKCPREAFHIRQQECIDGLEKDISLITALTAAAPLIGLLGTVIGMIETFEATASLSGNTGERVAEGISQALITTQLGLVIALPGVYGVSRLRALIQQTEIRFSSVRAAFLSTPSSGLNRHL